MKTPAIESLQQLERDVERALDSRDDSHLRVLGYGEISVVVALELGEERYACKRLPPMSSLQTFALFLTLSRPSLTTVQRFSNASCDIVNQFLATIWKTLGILQCWVSCA